MILIWYHYCEMKLITRETDYAVRALCFMARDKQKVFSAAELVKMLKIPRPFLRKILQTLNKKGMLESFKGQGGGFKLALKPENIFLLDIIKIFQGQLQINDCLFKKAPCPNINICKLRAKIDNINRFVISELKEITIFTQITP